MILGCSSIGCCARIHKCQLPCKRRLFTCNVVIDTTIGLQGSRRSHSTRPCTLAVFCIMYESSTPDDCQVASRRSAVASLLQFDTHYRCSWRAGCYGSQRHGASDVSCWLVSIATARGNHTALASSAIPSRDSDHPSRNLETRLIGNYFGTLSSCWTNCGSWQRLLPFCVGAAKQSADLAAWRRCSARSMPSGFAFSATETAASSARTWPWFSRS